MVYDVMMVVLRMLGAVAAAAMLVFGFVFFIFVGDANARGKPLVSRGFDGFAALVLYLSWFGLLWWFGFSQLLLMVACGATVILAVMYTASFNAARGRTPSPLGSEDAVHADGGEAHAV
jgi:hypothetical protein